MIAGFATQTSRTIKVEETPAVATIGAATPAGPSGELETIMLYGMTKVGKTMAACSVIDETLKKNPQATIFYVCTDNQLQQTLKYYFMERTDDVRKHMKIYNVFEFKKTATPLFGQIALTFLDIKKQAKKSDWLIVDLADKFYSWAQDEWINQSSPLNSATSYMSDAAKDLKRFMEFNRSQWQFIKKLDSTATFDIVEAPPCNLLYVFGEKEIELGEPASKDEKVREADDIFDLVGCKPGGQKTLPYLFATIVYLSGTKNKRFFTLGDRGYTLDYQEKSYGRNWFNSFLAERRK